MSAQESESTNSIYKKNIESLINNHPGFFKTLGGFQDIKENLDCKKIMTPSGYYTLEVQNKNLGRKVVLHDPMNPQKEAEMLTDSIDLKDGQLRFIVGLGLGYLPREIIKRELTLFTLVIVVTDAFLFKTAMEIVDLTDIFEAENVHFSNACDMNFYGILHYVSKTAPDAIRRAEMTYFEPERELFPNMFTVVTHKIQDDVKHIACGMTTSERIGPTFFNNQMRNLTTALESANISNLEGIFRDKPIVVVGAGPSLKNNIEELKSVRGKVAIITVDSSIPILVKNGIYPDLAATVDFHHISFEKYRDVILETEKIPIVYAIQCASMTIKPYRSKHKFFIAQNIGFLQQIAEGWGEWSDWYAIEAVSHLAIVTACLMGGSPIYLLGFDLGFVGFKSHSEGTALLQNIDIESLVWVDDKNGGKIPTSVQMIGQRALIEKHIENFDSNFINISEGVEIKGAENSDAAEAFKRLDNSVDGYGRIVKAWEGAKKPDNDFIKDKVKKEIKELKKVLKFCQKGVRVAENAKKELDGNPPAIKKNSKTWIQQAVDMYDGITKEIPPSLESGIWQFQGQDQDLLRAENNLLIGGDTLTGKEKIAVEMDLVYEAFRARQKALENLIKIFTEFFSRLSSETRALNALERKKSRKQRSVLYFELGDIYLRYDDFVMAENAFKKGLDEDSQNPMNYLGLSRVWRKQKQHSLAMDVLEKGLEVDKKNKLLGKAYEEEKGYPEELIKEAFSHFKGDGTESSGQGTENWVVRLCMEALELDPGNETARDLMDKAQKKLDNTKKRREEVLPYIVGELESSLDKISEIFESDPDFAIRVLDLLKKNNPENPSILELLGLSFLTKGNIEKAKNFIVQSRSLAPDALSPRIHLARILFEENKFEGAYSYIMEAWEEFPEYRIHIADIKGELEFSMGQFSDALSTYTRILKSDNSRFDVLYRISECYLNMGHSEAAEKAIQAAEQMKLSMGRV